MARGRSSRARTGGIVLHRVGGLSAVRQDNERAPARRGVWAFIWPYFDRHYLYLDGRSRVPEMKRDGKRVFLHRGDVWTRIEVPGYRLRVRAEDGGVWYLADADALVAQLPAVRVLDARFRRAHGGEALRVGPRAGAGAPWIDHYEVFVPRPSGGTFDEHRAVGQAKRGRRTDRRNNPAGRLNSPG